jgi:hypothetical protein
MNSYRYPSRLVITYAALLIILLGLCFYNGAGDLQYTVVWMIVLSPFLLFALCRLLITLLRRVEVDDDRIRYRGLLGSKVFGFSPEMELYVARGLFRCLLVCRLRWTVIRLRDDDGNRLRIALHWQAAEEIAEVIETYQIRHALPALQRAFAADEEIPFGWIAASPDEIRKKDKVVPLEGDNRCEIGNGDFSIRQRKPDGSGRWWSLLSVPCQKIANLRLMCLLYGWQVDLSNAARRDYTPPISF